MGQYEISKTSLPTVLAKDFRPGMNAFLWHENGNGYLSRVRYIQNDWWIITGATNSSWDEQHWCCTPNTLLIVCSDDDRVNYEKLLQKNLQIRRNLWNK